MRNIFYFVLISLVYIFSCGSNLHAAENSKAKTKYEQEVNVIIQKVKEAIEKRDFSILNTYVHKKTLNKRQTGPLYLGQCNTDDIINMTYEEMEKFLLEKSVDSTILINEDAAYGELIETTGWRGDRPYFYFQFTKIGNTWRWLGVCDDFERSLDYSEYLKKKSNSK